MPESYSVEQQALVKPRECDAVDCSTVFLVQRHPNGGWTRKRFCSRQCCHRHRDRRVYGHTPNEQRKAATAKRNAAKAQAMAERAAERNRVADLRRMLADVDRLARKLGRPCGCEPCQAERGRQARREWRRRNPDAARAERRRWKALNRGAEGRSTAEQDWARFAYYGGCCAYCRTDLTGIAWHWDHVIPLSRGGTNWAANLRPACPNCNASKRDQLLSEWTPGVGDGPIF